MKLVKNFVFAMIMVSAIAVNTPAGEQDVPGYAPPPPPRAASICDDKYTSDTDCAEPVGGSTTDTSDYLLFEALAALLSMY